MLIYGVDSTIEDVNSLRLPQIHYAENMNIIIRIWSNGHRYYGDIAALNLATFGQNQQHVFLQHIEAKTKMDAISQTTFSSAFSWMKMFEFRFEFHWSLPN